MPVSKREEDGHRACQAAAPPRRWKAFCPNTTCATILPLLTPTGASALCVCRCDVTRPDTRFPEQRKS